MFTFQVEVSNLH
jgi:hypothetical protein